MAANTHDASERNCVGHERQHENQCGGDERDVANSVPPRAVQQCPRTLGALNLVSHCGSCHDGNL